MHDQLKKGPPGKFRGKPFLSKTYERGDLRAEKKKKTGVLAVEPFDERDPPRGESQLVREGGGKN